MKKILFISLFGLYASAYSQGLLTNLRGCYPMDCDNAVNSATTGASLNGTPYNVSCTSGHGLAPSTAFQFAGNPGSYIELPNSPLLKPQAIAVSGWYHTPLPWMPQYLVFTKRNSGQQGNFEAYYLVINTSNFTAGLTGVQNLPQTVTHPLAIAANTWYHVVFYIDNTIIKLYVNGVLASANHNVSFSYDPTKGVILGGTNEPNANYPFYGKMDNIRFYDRDLTQAEVTDLYTNDPVCNSVGAGGGGGGGGCCLGNYCGSSLNSLTGDYQIPLNNFNFNFTSASASTSKVLIGQSACAPGVAKLDVKDGAIGNGIYSHCSTMTGNNIAIRGVAGDPTAHMAVNIFGVLGEENLSPGNHISGSAGVAGFCGPMNTALMPVGDNIGVYGNSLSNGGRWAGYFDGDLNLNGAPFSTFGGMWSTSDKRFKKDIVALSSVSDKLMNLRSYTYYFKTDEFKNMNFSKDEQIGLIAQELKEQFPQLVTEKNGYNYVNYTGLVPVLVAGFKEQQTKMEEQQQQIEELKTIVQSLAVAAGKTAGNPNSLAVTLGDKSTIVLNQNVPNPFAENTVITYNIPIGFGDAQIIFTTNDGIVIKTVIITEIGQGSLTVFANDLSHGVYTYALVVDGKTIDSKKMIKE